MQNLHIVDTHAHLTDKNFVGRLPEFLETARNADVRSVLCVGTNIDDSHQGIALAEEHPEVRAAVGIHPNVCCQAGEGDWEQIIKLSSHPRVAAIGETGLDKYWDDCPWEVQVDYFRRHLQLSHETQKPIVIHTRDCAEETLEILRDSAAQTGQTSGQISGVMHSFTGPQSVADGCLDLGLYISFAGMVTFKNASEIADIAKRIPEDRILVETDSPYLTPAPQRGKRPNHPAMTRHTLEFIAGLREVSVEQMAASTTQNAFRLFGAW
ncbi:MAG TPA: hydrolase TatD [Planctomycetaceae bacterium]|nr:hydrolase TatD [Planctomycetaceae bacterium]